MSSRSLSRSSQRTHCPLRGRPAGCVRLFDGIRVAHSDGVTSWHDVDRKRKLVFKSQDLRDAYHRDIDDGKCLLKDRPTLEPTPEQNESAYRN